MRFVLHSGRRVAVHRTRTGAESRVVVLCHSAPGAGLFDPDPLETQARNVTLLSVDRPGYGGSHPVTCGSWATVASAADDLAAVLESLGLERVGVAGWSAGGRVALALAARRPDLVERVAVLATPAPDAEVPWLPDEQRVELERLRDARPDEAHARLAERLAPAVPDDPHSPEALALLGAGPADDGELRYAGVRDRLGDMLQSAFAQGLHGLAADVAGYSLQPWGFDPRDIEAETLLVYGARDPLAGPRHGHWWHSRLRDARLVMVPGAGHLLVIRMWRRVLSHLAPDRPPLRVIDGGRNGAGAEVEEFSAA